MKDPVVIAQYVADHPRTIGFIFAVFTGIAGYNCYRAGIQVALIRGNIAREASEALGG